MGINLNAVQKVSAYYFVLFVRIPKVVLRVKTQPNFQNSCPACYGEEKEIRNPNINTLDAESFFPILKL